MFGYIYPVKLDLTFREFHKFKAYYCGVCKSIQGNFGNIERMSVNYDITFLAILLSAVYVEIDETTYDTCILDPFTKKKVIRNEIVEYCAFMNILLGYYKILDNVKDEKNLAFKVIQKIMNRTYQKSALQYPEKDRILRAFHEQIGKMEERTVATVDEYLDLFGNALAEVFEYRSGDEHSETLRNLGYEIGRYVYLMDSVDDFARDQKRKNFNPLNNCKNSGMKHFSEEKAEEILIKINQLLPKLKLKQSQGILNNILEFGLRKKAQKILKGGCKKCGKS